MGMQPLGAVPPPFAPPGAGMGMPMGGGQPQGDPLALVQAIRSLAPAVVKQPEPIYPPGYKPPKKKDPEEVLRTGKRLYDQHRLWRNLIYQTLRWTHQELTGMFPEDQKERELGFQEEYISPVLSAERNLVIARLMGMQPGFRALYTKDEYRGYAQRLEDLYKWLRDEERFTASRGGERPLEIDEAALFTDYGMYVSRDTFAPWRTNCPIDMRLIDPAQVYPLWDRAKGLREVYRVYSDTTAEITAAYGDFTDAQKKKLEDRVGRSMTDDTEFEVVEYWDTWYRCVLVAGVCVLEADHKYGDVPFTIQYGGGGDPMFTRTPSVGAWQLANDRYQITSGTRADERVRKATPYLYHRLRGHEIHEAIMARILTGFKKDINPPTIRYRSDAAAEKEMPQLDASPGAQNDAMLGEEKIEALPTTNLATTSTLLQQMLQDRQVGSMPPEAYGRFDKSNISGVAQQGANDAGMHLLAPLVRSWESALEQRYDRIARLLANFGVTAAAAAGTKLVVPVGRKPRSGQPLAYDFDREVIEKVGSRCKVSFSLVDPRDWAALFAAGKNGVDAGLITRAKVYEIATGDTDFDAFIDEWLEENAIFGATQLPEFQKFNVLDQMLSQARENAGNPEVAMRYLRMAELWQQNVLQPQPQMQPGMGQQPGMTQQPGMPPQQPGMPPGAPQDALQILPQTGATPGVPGQMSYPAMGAGPGSQGAPVGRPY